MWNLFLTRELEACVGHLSASFWILPIAHGAFLQRKCTLFGRIVNLSLVARRSCHFAGARGRAAARRRARARSRARPRARRGRNVAGP